MSKNTLKTSLYVLGLAMTSFTLTSCDQARRTFGLERHQPDEFNVMERPALSVPPSMSLKPPVARKTSDQGNLKSRQQAQDLVLKPPASTTMPMSTAEGNLLVKAGATQPPAHIRQVIDDESKTKSSERGMAEDLVFWKDPQPKGSVIDPVEEKKRLQESNKKTSEFNNNTPQDTP